MTKDMENKEEAAEVEEEAAASNEETASAETEAGAETAPAARGEDVEQPEQAGKSGKAEKKAKRSASGEGKAKKAKSPGDAHAGETDAAGSEEQVEESGPPKKWYVVHTYSGHENKVRQNILKMINTSPIKDHFGQIVVPTEEVAEMKKGKKTVTTRKFFPSYILIEMHMTDESWHLVNGIPGVTSFVGTGDKPQPLSKPEVERILGRMDKEKQTITPEIPFTLGEHIRIKDGPFSDFTGVIDEINAEKGKLKVLVSIFGRETPVELDFLQVEPV